MEQGHIETTASHEADLTFARARRVMMTGDFSKAEALLEQTLRENPNHADAQFTLAYYWLNVSRLEQAESLASTIHPNHTNPHTLLNLQGEIHLRRGRAREAQLAFQKSMDHCPTSVASVGLGVALTRLGRTSDAEHILRYTIERTDNCTTAYDALSKCLMPGPNYKEVLAFIHHRFEPATYLEIGVAMGESIQLAGPNTRAIGVDPNPKINFELSAQTSVHVETSDAFFEQYGVRELFGNRTIDLCFIDGLHTFDQALRDFINAEKHASPNAVFAFHDCYPFDRACATRKRQTTFWAGDVWKVIPILERYRPELTLSTIRTAPTGLGLVTGMNPDSTILEENFDSIVEEYLELDYDYLSTNETQRLHLVDNEWTTIIGLLPQPEKL